MKIKTINPVTYNSGLTGSTTKNVIGVITNANQFNDGKTLVINYHYKDEDGVILKDGSFRLDGEQALNNAFNLIVSSLPTADNEYPYTWTKYYQAFKYYMAQSFNTILDNIEIIND